MKWFALLFLLFASESFAGPGWCIGKASNTFYCQDDTNFLHCTGDDKGVKKSCPSKLCVTRTPADRNPCVGREAAAREDGVAPPFVVGGEVAAPPAAPGQAPVVIPLPPPQPPAPGVACVGGPKFDPAGTKNVGNGKGGQFITGQCLSNADCASGCCAGPCGICSGPGAQFQAGKTGCGFSSK